MLSFRSLPTRIVDDIAADPDPLPRPVREVGRPVKGDLDDVTRQQLRLQDVQLHERSPQTYDLWLGSITFKSSFIDGSKRFELWKVICYFHLVACEYHSRKGEEHPELWRSGDPREAVQHAQDVEEDVKLMREPEEAVGLLADDRVREQEDYADHGVKHDA